MRNKTLKIHRHKHVELLAFWLYCRRMWACQSTWLIHYSHYFQTWECKHSTHFSFQGIFLLSWHYGSHTTHIVQGTKYTQRRCMTVQLFWHFTELWAPFLWTFRKHLSQTISPSIYPLSLNQSKLGYCQFLIFNLKLSMFTEGTWKRVLK